jgi:hypothetical protein
MSSAITTVALTSLVAMGRIFLVSAVGYVCALYPKDSPLLPPATVKILSRLSNVLFLPCLIIYSLGSGLTLGLFLRMSKIIPFCLLNEVIAYGIAFTLGRILHEDDARLFTAVSIAIGSPNVISFPLMIMDTLCKRSTSVSGDFADSKACFVECTSMLFVYSIGWHFVFWGFGYPRLQSLLADNVSENNRVHDALNDKNALKQDYDIEMVSKGGDKDARNQKSEAEVATVESQLISNCAFRALDRIVQLFYRVMMSPPIICIVIGITIGVIDPLRSALFKDFTFLTPFGSALSTFADPIICLNCLIMSSSLATVTIFPRKIVKPAEFSTEAVKDKVDIPSSATEASVSGEDVQICSSLNDEISYSALDGSDINPEVRPVSIAYTTEGIMFSQLNKHVISSEMTGTRRRRSLTESDLSIISRHEKFIDHVKQIASKDGQVSNTNNSVLSSSSGIPNGESQRGEHFEPQAQKSSNVEPSDSNVAPPKLRTVAAMLLCRLVIAPLLILPIIKACMSSGFISKSERSFMLVVFLEAAAPSAQLLIVALSQLGLQKVASQIAYLYILQYTASILTITFWTTIAMSILYE